MAVIIPTDPTIVSYVQTTDIDGTEYRVRLDWNERTASWYLSLYDADENPLLLGRKVLNRFSVLDGFSYKAVPQGVLVSFDKSTIEKPNRDELGGSAQLAFLRNDEL